MDLCLSLTPVGCTSEIDLKLWSGGGGGGSRLTQNKKLKKKRKYLIQGLMKEKVSARSKFGVPSIVSYCCCFCCC